MICILFVAISSCSLLNSANGVQQSPAIWDAGRMRCLSCATTDVSVIVGGAGVHPGVYLSAIQVEDVPVTPFCGEPFQQLEAIRNGGVRMPSCDNGICVKINYTDRGTASSDVLRVCLPNSRGVFKPVCNQFSSTQAFGTCDEKSDLSCSRAHSENDLQLSAQEPLRCYSCATVDVGRILQGVQDENWRQWLQAKSEVPRTSACLDPIMPSIALRSGVETETCDKGVCMKMWFKERSGDAQIWRACIPDAEAQIRADCTRISSGDGDMEVCTCTGNLCNRAQHKAALSTLSVFVGLILGLSLI